MASTGGRRRPQKYPDELHERAVKMVLEVRQQTGEKHGAVTRVAKELGARLRWAAMGGRADLPRIGDRPHDLLVDEDTAGGRRLGR
jgi:hypothetical protein